MTEYVLWDAAYGLEASKRYTDLDKLRKETYNKIIKYGQKTRISSRFEVVSINYGKGWMYTGRGDLEAVGKNVYYTIWVDGRPTNRRRLVMPNGKLKVTYGQTCKKKTKKSRNNDYGIKGDWRPFEGM